MKELNERILKSLYLFYFGINIDIKDIKLSKEIVKKVSDIAYLDLARTLKGMAKIENNTKDKYKSNIEDLFFNFITEIINKEFNTKEDFDKKHEEICEEIINKYNEIIKKYNEICKLNYGQAQKWLNMFLKYMYILNYDDKLKLENVSHLFHMPIDNIVIDKLCKLKIIYNKDIYTPWSKMKKDVYLKLICDIRNKINNQSMLKFEIDNWKS